MWRLKAFVFCPQTVLMWVQLKQIFILYLSFFLCVLTPSKFTTAASYQKKGGRRISVTADHSRHWTTTAAIQRLVRSVPRTSFLRERTNGHLRPLARGWPGQRGWQGSCLSCPAEFRRWLVILSTPCSIGWLLLRIEAGADFLVLIRTANTFKMDYRADRPLPNKVFFPLCLMVSNPFVIA